MSVRRQLIVVSNRGPVTYGRTPDGHLSTHRGAGGLVAALRPLAGEHDVTWVASALTEGDCEVAASGPRQELVAGGGSVRLRLVAHEAAAFRLFYCVVANPVLSFLQHGLWALKRDPAADLTRPWEHGYVAVNRRLADAALAELRRSPGAALLFHDYHLYVAPSLVRAAAPHARLAHFVHVPWVEPEAWSVLPPAITCAIHQGLLACDSIGFHTERWRASFVACCEALLGRGAEAEARTHANPAAVDVAEIESYAASDEVRALGARLRASLPERLVLRVDRTDPAKNAVRGFNAFARLLERRPDLRGRVTMLALLHPSRQEIPEYADYRAATERAAGEVNDRHGHDAWRPVRLEVRDDFASSVAAYLEYDALLVNPVRDGLNLVAKEAPLVNRRDGALVLSRHAGAYEELGEWALGIDPLDVEETAATLERALLLPAAERRRRAAGIRDRLRAHDARAWADAELAALDAAR